MCIFEKKTLFFVIYVSLKYIMDLYKFLILDYIGKVENYSIKMFTHYLNMKIAYFHAIERNWVKMYYFWEFYKKSRVFVQFILHYYFKYLLPYSLSRYYIFVQADQ